MASDQQESKKTKHHLKKKEKLEKLNGDFYILGCDLSLSRPGFCVVLYESTTKKVKFISKTNVCTKNLKTRAEKLNMISEIFISIVEENQDKIIIPVRENSFSRFAAETQAISEVNGVCSLCLYNKTKKEFELLSPLSVKKLMTGTARASKEEVAESIKEYCKDNIEFECNDESDAMAVAIAWLIDNGYVEQKEGE